MEAKQTKSSYFIYVALLKNVMTHHKYGKDNRKGATKSSFNYKYNFCQKNSLTSTKIIS